MWYGYVGVGVWSSQLLDKISTHQVVTASSIDDDTCLAVLHDEENLKQVMTMKIIWLAYLSIEHSWNNDGHVLVC
jgi:hypothetical protein